MKNTQLDYPCPDEIELTQDIKLPLKTFLRHISLIGASGSGKTVASKVLCEELAIRGIPIIAIDPQGDIASLMTMGNREIISEKGGNLEHYEIYKQDVEVVVWTPMSDAGIPIHVSPLSIELSDDEDENIREITTVSQNLTNLLGYDLQKNRGRFVSAALDIILTYAYNYNLNIKSFADLVDLMRNMPDELQRDVSSILSKNQLIDIVKNIMTLTIGSSKFMFNKGVPLDINTLIGKDTDKTRISVIYLNTLATQDEKNFFVAQVAIELYRWMLSNPSSKLQVLFYIDEIAPFLPPVSKPASKDILRLLFKQARKYGVGCLLATQNPGDVDYKSLAQVSTYFLGRLMTDQDIKKVDQMLKSVTGGNAGNVVQKLPNLKTGNFELFSPDNFSSIKDVNIRWLYSKHETYDESDLEDKISNELREKFQNNENHSSNTEIILTPIQNNEYSNLQLITDKRDILFKSSDLRIGDFVNFKMHDFISLTKNNVGTHVSAIFVIRDKMYAGNFHLVRCLEESTRYLLCPVAQVIQPAFLRMFHTINTHRDYMRYSEVFVMYCYKNNRVEQTISTIDLAKDNVLFSDMLNSKICSLADGNLRKAEEWDMDIFTILCSMNVQPNQYIKLKTYHIQQL